MSFFAWVRGQTLAKMIDYNQGGLSSGPLVLARYPRSAAEIRRNLASPRYLAWAPEWR